VDIGMAEQLISGALGGSAVCQTARIDVVSA
jgi:hypothetical protein